MSDEAYLRIRRFARPRTTVPDLSPRLGFNNAPMGYTVPPKPDLYVKIDGKTIGINTWTGSRFPPELMKRTDGRNGPVEAQRDYVVEPGEHLLELVVRRFSFFESRTVGNFASCPLSIKPGEIHTVVCQQGTRWMFLLFPDENFEINTLGIISRK